MTVPTLERTAQRALQHYGLDAQRLKAVEELFELGQALMHWRDAKVPQEKVVEELADVLVVCESLRQYLGPEVVDVEVEWKRGRLQGRIEWEDAK